MDINFSVKVGACLYLSVVFAIGLVGNAFVGWVVYTVKRMRTATNLILVNLAVADIISCVMSIPIMVASFITNIQYDTIKDVSKVHFVLTVGAGMPLVFCHLLLCIDRYDSVMRPFNRRITKARMRRISMVIWVTSAMSSLLSAILIVLVPMQWFLDEEIDENQTGVPLSQAFDVVALIVILLTLFCMLQSFVSLRRGLKQHTNTLARSLGQTTLEKEMQLSSAAVILVSSFALTSLPWLIARFLHFTSTHQNLETFVLCYSTMHASHAINPLVYAGYMRNFRREVTTMIQNWLNKPYVCCRGTEVHPAGADQTV